MKNSQLSLFIEKLKTDEALRQKLLYAEKEAGLKLNQEIDAIREANLESIKQIAQEAGYDISIDIGRPSKAVTPTEQEMENLSCWLFTCCVVFTSVWDTEGLPPHFTANCPTTELEVCPIVVP